MTYNEAKDFMEMVSKRRGMVLGLDSMRALLRQLGNPEKELSVIHVAGTNGKGSVMAFLAGILSEQGYRVGRFSSPAVFSMREILSVTSDKKKNQRINYISREEYTSLVCVLKEKAQYLEKEQSILLTRFELETAMAFLYFNNHSCDFCLLETGLGGDMDATNVIEKPVLSMIMSISFDHCAVLGDTIEEIAAHKAGIMKPGCPVVCYEPEVEARSVRTVLEEHAKKLSCDCTFADFSRLKTELDTEAEVLISYGNYRFLNLGLNGEMQKKNAAVALEAVKVLQKRGIEISELAVRQGLKKADWPGRFEQLSKSPCIIIDGAHNPDAAKALVDSLRKRFGERKHVFVLGAFKDKDLEGVLSQLLPVMEIAFCVTTHGERAKNNEELVHLIKTMGGKAKACELDGVLRSAVSEAQRMRSGKDVCVQEKEAFIANEQDKPFVKSTDEPEKEAYASTKQNRSEQQDASEPIGEESLAVIACGSLSYLKDIRKQWQCMNENKTPGIQVDMERVRQVWNQKPFQAALGTISKLEQTRTFCKHGQDHLLDVARLGWILILENQLQNVLPKDMIYTAALLHDLGRSSKEPGHARQSEKLAGEILSGCGTFSEEEISQMCFAIRMHGELDKNELSEKDLYQLALEAAQKADSEADPKCERFEMIWDSLGNKVIQETYSQVYEMNPKYLLAAVLAKADHDVRDCYCCHAAKECYWQEKRRVKGILG